MKKGVLGGLIAAGIVFLFKIYEVIYSMNTPKHLLVWFSYPRRFNGALLNYCSKTINVAANFLLDLSKMSYYDHQTLFTAIFILVPIIFYFFFGLILEVILRKVNKPYWIKGGLSGFSLGITIFILLFIFSIADPGGPNPDWYPASGGLDTPFLIVEPISILFLTIVGTVIGFVIGPIIDKRKERKSTGKSNRSSNKLQISQKLN